MQRASNHISSTRPWYRYWPNGNFLHPEGLCYRPWPIFDVKGNSRRGKGRDDVDDEKTRLVMSMSMPLEPTGRRWRKCSPVSPFARQRLSNCLPGQINSSSSTITNQSSMSQEHCSWYNWLLYSSESIYRAQSWLHVGKVRSLRFLCSSKTPQ